MCYCDHDCNCRRCTDKRNMEAGIGGALLLVGGIFLAGWAVYKLGKGAINLLSSSNTTARKLTSPIQNNDKEESEWDELPIIKSKKNIEASAQLVEKVVAKKGVDDFPDPELQLCEVTNEFMIKTNEKSIKIPKGYKLNIKIYNYDPAKFRVMPDHELINNEILLIADLFWFCDHINTDVSDYPEAVC